jgi:hypothetical protein
VISEPITRLDSTRPFLSLSIETNLIGFWSISAREANLLALNDQRVTVNDARQTGNRFFTMRRGSDKGQENGCDADPASIRHCGTVKELHREPLNTAEMFREPVLNYQNEGYTTKASNG